MIEKAESGATVIFISADLDEVLLLSDRFIILYKGQIYGPYEKGELNTHQVSLIMNGASNEVRELI